MPNILGRILIGEVIDRGPLIHNQQQALLIELVDVAVSKVEHRVMKETSVGLVAQEWDAKSGVLADAEDVLSFAKFVLLLFALDDNDTGFDD
jgi:hypothetical protein